MFIIACFIGFCGSAFIVVIALLVKVLFCNLFWCFFWGGEGEGKVWACLSEEIECRNAFCRFLVVGGLLEVCVGWVFV